MKGSTSDQTNAASGGGLSLRSIFVIALVAVVLGAAVIYVMIRREGRDETVPGKAQVAVVPEGTRSVALYFADSEKQALISETRQVAIGKDFSSEVRQVIIALLEGPEYSGVSAIPEQTSILDVFYDPETMTLYLDFSSEFVAGHTGGSAAEYYSIAVVMRTISENFPEITAVQILVEGFQVGTIGGHINANNPFLVREWR